MTMTTPTRLSTLRTNATLKTVAQAAVDKAVRLDRRQSELFRDIRTARAAGDHRLHREDFVALERQASNTSRERGEWTDVAVHLARHAGLEISAEFADIAASR